MVYGTINPNVCAWYHEQTAKRLRRKSGAGAAAIAIVVSLFLGGWLVTTQWQGNEWKSVLIYDNIDTELQPSVAATGSLSATGKSDYYRISATGTKLTVVLDGPSGADFDLYVKKDAKPTTSSYNARGYTSSADETVTISNPSGLYYIMVHSYKGSGSYTLVANVQGGSSSGSGGNGIPEKQWNVQFTDSINVNEKKSYMFLSTPNTSRITIVLDGPNSGADFDLYVKFGSVPTTSDYAYRGYTNSADERIEFVTGDVWAAYVGANTMYVMVHAYRGSGSFTLIATATPQSGGNNNNGITELTLGTPKTGSLSGTGASANYKVVVSTAATLTIQLTGPSGVDFDLYVKKGSQPTTSNYDKKSDGYTASETITISNAQGIYYILVRSYRGSGQFTIKATTSGQSDGSGDPNDGDGDGLWDSVERRYGTDPYSNQYSAQADKIPWSGYWWPMKDGGTAGPCAKYDEYVNKTYGYNPGAEAWERANHGDPNSESWWGHCHAWAAAAILEDEPTGPVTRNGVTFTVGDLKGLLTECHYNDIADMFIGRRCNDKNNSATRDDVTAKDFHITLLKWIGTMRKAIVADIHALEEVWNHPLYKYSMRVTVDPQDSTKRHYVCTVTYVSDAVSENYVGHSDFTKTYYYWLQFMNGDISSFGWEGSSADALSNKYAHPDFFWHPGYQRAAWGCPLNYQTVKQIITG